MKGQRILIEAFNLLVNQRNYGGLLSLDLIGDGESKDELVALTKQYGLENYIRFLGSQTREMFYPKLRDYDLFVLPSVSEGFGLTLAEACAARIPVITCDLEGPMEVIANGRYGCSFEAGNANSLADALINYIEQETNVEQVEAAYNYVRSHFDVRTTASEYIKQYEQVIQ
jgi:glycosyltransferase involved in cell wall biosynthesis